MAEICPTVLAEDAHAYREQMERIAPFAKRVQIDLSDGQFATVKTIDPALAWWPEGVKADLHLMFKRPMQQLQTVLDLKPSLVIVHAEAEGDFETFAAQLGKAGIKAGVALLPETPVSLIKPSLSVIDHVLIFSGDLGHFGGSADLSLTAKVSELKSLKPGLEIGWDGGVNTDNVRALAKAGVDVLNAGGAIQRADDPPAAYNMLTERLGNDQTDA